MSELTYNPAVFETPSLEEAKRIILTQEGGRDTDERWRRETPYLANLLGEKLRLGPEKIVIDYGCGVGRLSKALIEQFGCQVLGVDISQEMRALAPNYVQSAAFSVVSRRVLQVMAQRGFRADSAIAVWVLQHCRDPAEDIGLLRSTLAPSAPVGLVNNRARAVPAVEVRWANDGVDVRALMQGEFQELESGSLDPNHVGQRLADHTFWAAYSAQ